MTRNPNQADDDALARRESALSDLARRRASYESKPPEVAVPRASDRMRRQRWSSLVAIVKDLQFDAGVTALGRELSVHDGFPTSPGERTRPRPVDPNDPAALSEEPVSLTVVEQLASRGMPLARDMETVDRCLQSIVSEVSRLQRVIDRYAPPAAHVKMPCEVGTYNEPWAEPRQGEAFPCPEEMEHHPSGNPRSDHLCSKHRKRKERWERAHGKTGAA